MGIKVVRYKSNTIDANVNLKDAVIEDGSTTDNDTLSATLTGALTGTDAPLIQNIETLSLNMLGTGAGLDFSAIINAKTVDVSGAVDGILTEYAAEGPEVNLKGGYNKALTVAFDTLAGTSTSDPESLTVNLEDAGSKAAVQINIEGTANTGTLEELTVNSNGSAANTLAVGTEDYDTGYSSADGISKFTVGGTQDLTLKVDHATISTKELTNTGEGNLTLDVNRMDGTTALTTQVTNLSQATGFETLVLRGTGDVNVSGIASGSTVKLVDSFAGTASDSLGVQGAATGQNDSLTLELDHKTASTNFTFNNAFAVNDVETLSILSEGGNDTGHKLGDTSTGFEANAVETLSLSGDTKLTLNLNATNTKFETLNIEGAGKHAVDFVTTSVSYAAEENVTVSAGTATGDLTLDLSDITLNTAVSDVEVMTVTTGTGADGITLGDFAGAELVLDAGDGGNNSTKQTITVGNFGNTGGSAASDAYTSASTITTGTGTDVITVGLVQGDDTYVKASLAIDAGDGDNTVFLQGSSSATAETHSGVISVSTGTGKDAIVFGTAITESNSDLDSSSAKVTLTTGAGDDTVKLGNVTASGKGSSVDLGEGNDKVYIGIEASGTGAITNEISITTGAGQDTVYLFQPDHATATGQGQKITITDFTEGAGGDVLDLAGWAGSDFASAVDLATGGADFNAALDSATTGQKVHLLGAFDAADIGAATHATTDTIGKAFNLGTSESSDAGEALAVLFNNNTGLTEVWWAYDTDSTATSDVVVEQIATLENINLAGISDLTFDNFDFA